MQRVLTTIKQNKWFVVINAVFFILYSLISFVNHYNFRTYALDLGLYTRALYDYAHFHYSNGEVFWLVPENILTDHFDLLLMLFSPLYWVFGSITLLVIQIVFIHIGAWGTYRLAQYSDIDKTKSTFISLVFLSCFGIFSAVSYDYHSNLVAVCLLPWFVLFFKQGKLAYSALIFSLILIAKENMALWMFFVCIGLIFLQKNSDRKKMAIVFSVISIFYFFLIIFYIMPSLSWKEGYTHVEFHVLGNFFSEIFFNILKHPIDAFVLLFKNHLPDEKLKFVKIETWCFWFISGGFLFFYRPAFFLMIIPIMMQKMYHDDAAKWSVTGQYNVEFIPLIAWCLIESVKSTSEKKRSILIGTTVMLSIAITIRLCDHTVIFTDKSRIRFYQSDHYKSDFDTRLLYETISKIPKNATVSAQSMFVPHLVDRGHIYQYPIIKDAQYILLSDNEHSYPLSKKEMLKNIQTLLSSPKWHYIPTNRHVYLFKISEKP